MQRKSSEKKHFIVWKLRDKILAFINLYDYSNRLFNLIITAK